MGAGGIGGQFMIEPGRIGQPGSEHPPVFAPHGILLHMYVTVPPPAGCS